MVGGAQPNLLSLKHSRLWPSPQFHACAKLEGKVLFVWCITQKTTKRELASNDCLEQHELIQ